jgi:hypothetical protein
MTTRHHTKLIHEGKYVAEIDIEMIENEEGWSPYISVEDAYKLDDLRDALKRGDIKKASQLGRLFSLTPVSI